MKNLDTPTLAKCSEVNKLWHLKGRKLLKTRRCYAHCGDDGVCEDLKQVDQFMEKVTDPAEFLYNGLYLTFESDWHGNASTGPSCLNKRYNEIAVNIYDNMLTKFPLKYLKINWYGHEPQLSCPAALLIPKLLLHHGQTLEEIELVDGPFRLDWLYDYRNIRNAALLLPSLKVMRGKPLTAQVFSPKDIWTLVHVAPNLEELLVCVTSKDLNTGLAPPDRYKIIKSLCFECLNNSDVQAYSKFVSKEPKLRSLLLKCSFGAYRNINDSEWHDSSSNDSHSDGSDDDDDLDMDLCWEIFERLLKSSQKSLEMIRLPVRVLATQFGSDWQVFPNVRELSLEIPLKQHAEELYDHEVIRYFDFRTGFPNLRAVTLCDNERDPKDDPEDDDDFLNSVSDLPMLPLVYSSKISRLTLENHVTDFGLMYASSVFAHVTELDLSISESSDIRLPYGTIWKEFPKLEVLSVREGFWRRRVNYDADFLGISRVEARQLQKLKELEELKDFEIVPTKPAITTTKSKTCTHSKF